MHACVHVRMCACEVTCVFMHAFVHIYIYIHVGR